MSNDTFDMLIELLQQKELKSKGAERPSKRKASELAEVDELFTAELKKVRDEQRNCNKQLHDKINGLMKRNGNYNRADSKSGDLPRLICYHCAKAGHPFSKCPTASETEIQKIRRELQEKKFDHNQVRQRYQESLNSSKATASASLS
jgi:hypothetical protein